MFKRNLAEIQLAFTVGMPLASLVVVHNRHKKNIMKISSMLLVWVQVFILVMIYTPSSLWKGYRL